MIKKIIEKNRGSVLLLRLFQKLPDKQARVSARGTGFMIDSRGYFLTCAHVWNSLTEEEKHLLQVLVPQVPDKTGLINYDPFPVKLVEKDDQNDVAIFQVESERTDFQVVVLEDSSDDPEEGEDVVFLGFPLSTELLSLGFGLTLVTSSSIISSVKRKKESGELDFFIIDSNANKGSSGSPIFSHSTGKVIGLVQGRISQHFNIENNEIEIPSNIGICKSIKVAHSLISKI